MFRFGYNIVISYEYLSKAQLNEALESVNDAAKILLSINKDDVFLNSIKAALKHVTYSLKGYIMSLCHIKTMVMVKLNCLIFTIKFLFNYIISGFRRF